MDVNEICKVKVIKGNSRINLFVVFLFMEIKFKNFYRQLQLNSLLSDSTNNTSSNYNQCRRF